jgi:poly(ADP-ribose) glycohydrolase ARH3
VEIIQATASTEWGRPRYQGPVSTRDRFRGVMLGLAVGDCLGRPVEGWASVPEDYIGEVLAGPRSMVYSDDTAMTMVLTRSLLECGGFSGSHMSVAFADEYEAAAFRGYGRNVVEVFRRVRAGHPWDKAAARQFGGQGSYGNGAAMRVAPVALWAYPDVDATAELAADTARVTHTHPVGVEGAVVQAVATYHALGDSGPEELLEDVTRRVASDEFRTRLEMLPALLRDPDDDRARLHLGNWVSAHKSVVTALYCFLAGSDFTEVTVRALRMGGDVDTIAAMAGALAGGRHGVGAIPDRWRGVEDAGELTRLADALWDRTRT